VPRRLQCCVCDSAYASGSSLSLGPAYSVVPATVLRPSALGSGKHPAIRFPEPFPGNPRAAGDDKAPAKSRRLPFAPDPEGSREHGKSQVAWGPRCLTPPRAPSQPSTSQAEGERVGTPRSSPSWPSSSCRRRRGAVEPKQRSRKTPAPPPAVVDARLRRSSTEDEGQAPAAFARARVLRRGQGGCWGSGPAHVRVSGPLCGLEEFPVKTASTRGSEENNH
jgi:hypothetical protein